MFTPPLTPRKPHPAAPFSPTTTSEGLVKMSSIEQEFRTVVTRRPCCYTNRTMTWRMPCVFSTPG